MVSSLEDKLSVVSNLHFCLKVREISHYTHVDISLGKPHEGTKER